ncbi:hypothetical protein B0G57_1123 [Trinickia symbiotica]|nr:hypothetical protein B0G57_1123 [Trinickia symbiotica]
MPFIARLGVGRSLTLCALGATHGQTIVRGGSFRKTFNFIPEKTPCVVLRSALRELGLYFARMPAVIIVLALACTLYPMFARADGDYITASVGYYNNNRAIFKIPRKYKPEVQESFFKIIVDYPSMQPTVGRRSPPISFNSLDIIVEGYPKNGTLADDLISGDTGARFIGRENDRAVYSEPLGKNADQKAIIFTDHQGDSVVVEILGSWAVRNRITHGVRGRYAFRFSVSKNVKVRFEDIDEAVRKLIASMYVSNQ